MLRISLPSAAISASSLCFIVAATYARVPALIGGEAELLEDGHAHLRGDGHDHHHEHHDVVGRAAIAALAAWKSGTKRVRERLVRRVSTAFD